MIAISAESEDERALWCTLLDLAEQARDWTLIGARMVELHAAATRRTALRTSLDGDVLADARTKPNAVRRVAKILVAKEFALREPSSMGIGHAFVKGNVAIDVLAPENLGPRSRELRTTIRGARTVEVPGGRQALARTERVAIRVGGGEGVLPRPNLLGAILLKARAIEVDDVPESQRSDLAVLLSLVQDPESRIADLRGRERSWLRRHIEMDDLAATAWQGLREDEARSGLVALRMLAGW